MEKSTQVLIALAIVTLVFTGAVIWLQVQIDKLRKLAVGTAMLSLTRSLKDINDRISKTTEEKK